MKFKQFVKESKSSDKFVLTINEDFEYPVNESIDDMENRCEHCNMLLNDMGQCPACDQGEEDNSDESINDLEENCSNKVEEELTNMEKLKRAFPELDFDTPVQESVDSVKEELTNLQKLKLAYPELDFDSEPSTELNEGAGADLKLAVKKGMQLLSKKDEKDVSSSVVKVVEEIPDSMADELFDVIINRFKNVQLDKETANELVDAAGSDAEVQESSTLSKVFELVDLKEKVKSNPNFAKTYVISVLGVLSIIEPTPILELVTAFVSMMPADTISKILSVLDAINHPGRTIVNAAKSRMNKNESLDDADDDSDYEEENSFNYYDDDYYDLDDIEEDHLHAALYGGDRTYCDCGKKLIRTEYGSYCPDCDEPEEI